jgi:hypothetical protein
MSSSLAFLWFSTGNIKAVMYSGIFMLLVAVWAWRFPGTVEEHAKRTKLGKRIGWLK